ncbi:Thioredoxin reductase [Treponema sp. JC4]|uniref:NAD(P)/FAD-dependent oxidoreductase n=1 Tax=Treponema sp. JC4 TaxID=1124982 RepID=UPI00025B0D89|nr:NAD(P)/FAD-dependent oxidoreductase [Treponema sp. JC4]EID85772.1 Thioredoxin reductase [Treponema sp. JC4]
MYDVIVIGAGPAGISAALYAKRANLNVVVLYHGESQLDKAHKIDNYYGFENGISGPDLYAAGIKQAKNLGIEVLDSEVTNIQMASQNSYMVSSTGGDYEGNAVILATGNKKLRPNLKGLLEHEGKGVSYCAVCDGFFYRKKKVCVLGNKLYALEEAMHLANMAESVTILTNGMDDSEITSLLEEEKAKGGAAEKIQLNKQKLSEIKGEGKVESIVFEDGSELATDGFFVALGSAGGADFAKKLGLTLNGDSIATDEKMATNAPGVYSCGNVNGGLLQVCKAVYEGGVAGLSAVEYVRGLKK